MDDDELEARAVWSAAYVNDLPDSAFLYIEPGGEKDEDGRTTPRSLRHFPYKDASGEVDLPHLRNALARIPQADLPADVKEKATAKARRILEGERSGTEVALEVRSAPEGDLEMRELEDGHFHFSGYAAVFDAPSDPLPFIETIRPGAFTRTLRQAREIPLLINHDRSRLPLAVTPKTLRLTEDDRGLRVEADIPPTSDARDLAMHAAAGNVRHMSFAFKPVKTGNEEGERWPDPMTRELLHVKLAETSVLIGNPPAYRQTTAYIRSLAHRLDVEPDGLTVAIAGLEEGRPLTNEEARLLEVAIAELRLADVRLGPPISVLQRRLALEEKFAT